MPIPRQSVIDSLDGQADARGRGEGSDLNFPDDERATLTPCRLAR